MDQVITAALTSQPISISGGERAPSSSWGVVSNAKPTRLLKFRGERAPSSSWGVVSNAKPTRLLKFRHYRVCYSKSSSNVRNRGMVLLRNQHCMVHALPLQAVTTENGSEGSMSPGQSSVEYAAIFQPEQGGQRSLLYYIRVWYTNAKVQNVPESIQQVLEKSRTELQIIDKCQILQQIKTSKLATFGIHWWESSPPWIKWPLSTFIPWFLIVSLFYGTSASIDLLPLWITGPIFTGMAIRSSIWLSESYRQWLADRKVGEILTSMTEELKTGKLPRQALETARSRFEEVKVRSFKRKEELELFFRGEYKKKLREFTDKKLLELREVCIDKYEDWRLLFLYLERKLKNML